MTPDAVPRSLPAAVDTSATASAPGPPQPDAGPPAPPTAGASSSGTAAPTDQPGPASAASADSHAGAAAGLPSDPAALELLARRLYGRFSRRLADELLAERERAQLLTDLA
jgi:hypothetical protein